MNRGITMAEHEEKLTDEEHNALARLVGCGKALRIIDALTARAASLEVQVQRDHALAAEWHATADVYRVALGVARDRAEKAERGARQRIAHLESELSLSESECTTLRAKSDADDEL